MTNMSFCEDGKPISKTRRKAKLQRKLRCLLSKEEDLLFAKKG